MQLKLRRTYLSYHNENVNIPRKENSHMELLCCTEGSQERRNAYVTFLFILIFFLYFYTSVKIVVWYADTVFWNKSDFEYLDYYLALCIYHLNFKTKEFNLLYVLWRIVTILKKIGQVLRCWKNWFWLKMFHQNYVLYTQL